MFQKRCQELLFVIIHLLKPSYKTSRTIKHEWKKRRKTWLLTATVDLWWSLINIITPNKEVQWCNVSNRQTQFYYHEPLITSNERRYKNEEKLNPVSFFFRLPSKQSLFNGTTGSFIFSLTFSYRWDSLLLSLSLYFTIYKSLRYFKCLVLLKCISIVLKILIFYIRINIKCFRNAMLCMITRQTKTETSKIQGKKKKLW